MVEYNSLLLERWEKRLAKAYSPDDCAVIMQKIKRWYEWGDVYDWDWDTVDLFAQQLIDSLVNPKGVQQGKTGTCGPAVIQQVFILKAPIDYLTMILSLSLGRSWVAKTGVCYKPNLSWLPIKHSQFLIEDRSVVGFPITGQSAVEALFQAAIMDELGWWPWSASLDMDIQQGAWWKLTQTRTGMTPNELVRTLNNLMDLGWSWDWSKSLFSKKELRLTGETPVLLRLSDPRYLVSLHWVLAMKSSNIEEVRYWTWGSEHHQSREDLLNRVWGWASLAHRDSKKQ